MTASEGGQGSAGQDPVEPLSLSSAPASRRRAFRIWRRSRPFWGGLLLLLAGLEMLAIPLLSVLAHTSLKVIIYIGIGGVFGVLIGGLLMACGLLIWFHPSQRIFYAIAGVLLAVVSFVATNLGGFFAGMLLGVTGASLSFGWAPVTGREPPSRRHRRPHHDGPSDGLGIVLRDQAGGRAAPGDHRRGGDRLMALAITPLVLSGLMLPVSLGSPMRPASSQLICIIPIPFICPAPSPTPSPAASATPTPAVLPTTLLPTTVLPTTVLPTTSPTVTGTPDPAASGSPRPTGSPSASATAQLKAPAPGQLAAAAQSTLTADSALLEGLSYDGVAQVATANGTVTMMKFTLSSLTLTGNIALTVSEGGGTAVTRSSSMHFGGPVVLYATKLSGDLLGIPVTITPTSPLATILQLLAPVTRAVPVPMTHVVTDQPYTTAGSLQAGGLQIGA
jgi:Family of unknown function (DUF6114)